MDTALHAARPLLLDVVGPKELRRATRDRRSRVDIHTTKAHDSASDAPDPARRAHRPSRGRRGAFAVAVPVLREGFSGWFGAVENYA
ncbi:hypothetical protein [Streptomyces sp. NPDC052179]|uniref:hypothetical protein n=1 Tax=Streptomyces sp. NPDC052179 TaxID=3155680 RepID=UPI0034297355